MDRNEVIANYVLEKYPQLLNTVEFSAYSLGWATKEAVEGFRNGFIRAEIEAWKRRKSGCVKSQEHDV